MTKCIHCGNEFPSSEVMALERYADSLQNRLNFSQETIGEIKNIIKQSIAATTQRSEHSMALITLIELEKKLNQKGLFL